MDATEEVKGLGRDVLENPAGAFDVDQEAESSKADSMLETWAGHFGSHQERCQEKRELNFSEGIGDVADQVSLCLTTLPVIAEKMLAENRPFDIGSGLITIYELICDSAKKTISTLYQEVRALKQENMVMKRAFQESKDQANQAKRCGEAQEIANENESLYGTDCVQIGLALFNRLSDCDRGILQSLIREGAALEQIGQKAGELEEERYAQAV